MAEKRYNAQRFRVLMSNKLKEKGYNVSSFTRKYKFHRNPLSRALNGASRPTPETLTNWCQSLECTPEERTEMFHSVGHFTPEELDEESSRAA